MSRFGFESTTEDVLEGIDLTGKNADLDLRLDPARADARWELSERLVE